jgi:uncharacterized protein (DUF1499 family)
MAQMFLIIVLVLIILRLTITAVSPKAIKIRPTDGKLPDCPSTPNCVSSQATRVDQKVEPLKFSCPTEEAMLRLKLAVDAMPGTTVVKDDRIYMHVEYKTLVFGFVGDVEFLIDESKRLIHLRSASRLGYTDLGSNRRRVEAIRRFFENIK